MAGRPTSNTPSPSPLGIYQGGDGFGHDFMASGSYSLSGLGIEGALHTTDIRRSLAVVDANRMRQVIEALQPPSQTLGSGPFV